MGKTVLVFGNPLVEGDSIALKVAEELKGKIPGVEFKHVESLDEAEEKKDLCIMDAVVGIENVRLIEDIEELKTTQPVSGHDFDLALELKMLRKVGRVGKVEIIAIPAECDAKKAAAEAEILLKRIATN